MDEIKKILKEQRQLCLQNLSITNLDPIYQDQILNAPEPNSKSSCAGVIQNEHTEGSSANGLATEDFKKLIKDYELSEEVDFSYPKKLYYYEPSFADGKLIIHLLRDERTFRVGVCEYSYIDGIDLFETEDIERVKTFMSWFKASRQ